VFEGPDPIEVPNADAAVSLTATFGDSRGNQYIVAVRMAVRGQTAYTFLLMVSRDYYASDPNFGRILDSFQLTPVSQTGPGSPPLSRAQAFGLYPEEAVIALLPYRLSNQDVLPGYSVGAT